MNGQNSYKRDVLLQDLLSIDPAAKYDTNPEPGVAFDESEPLYDKSMDTYYYISDKDGKMKWLFPSTSRFPLFLTFHKDPTLRTQLYKLLVNLAFRLKLKKLVVSGSLKLANTKFHQLAEVLRGIDYDDFVLSSEQIQACGKSVFAVGKKGKVTHWVKVAHTAEAEDEMENEMYALEILDQNFLKTLFYDSIAHFSIPNVLVLANRKPRRAKQSYTLGQEHIGLLIELYEQYIHEFSFEDLLVYREIKDNIVFVEDCLNSVEVEGKPIISELFNRVKQSFQEIPAYYCIPVSFAHNNFTPQNIYKKSNKLHITGWGNSKESMPVLHDLFHFVYQSSDLLGWNIQKTKTHIDKALQYDSMKEFVYQNGIDPQLQHKIYLIYVVTRKLRGLFESANLSAHSKQRWEFWEEIFESELFKK